MFKLHEKTSALQREHPELQKMKFFSFFLCLWVIFVLLDPDPDCESGSGLRIRIRIRIQRPHRIRIHST